MDSIKLPDKKPYRQPSVKDYHQPQVKDYGNIKELTHSGPGRKVRDNPWSGQKHS
jgi:hypothetical protein